MGGWTERGPVTVEVDNERLEYRFYIGEVEPLDPSWPLVLGDCLHNLRATLDYLVFQLHVRHYRGTVPKIVADSTEFPIRDKRWHYRSGPRKGLPIPTDDWPGIKHLARRERTAIEWLQPYNARNDTLQIVRIPLRDIHNLDIADKHRHFHLVTAVLFATGDLTPPDGSWFEHDPAFRVPLESNACVDRWLFKTPPPQDEVEVYRHVKTAVGLEYGGEWLEILSILRGALFAVGAVLARFSRLFPPLDVGPFDLAELLRPVEG